MANWAALQEQLMGKPVYKRAKHGIHFKRPDGVIEANFSGVPCHYFDGEWRAIDTTPIKLPDGRFGCPHSPLRIASDGTVSIEGAAYSQRARLFSAASVKLDGDRLVRAFNGGEQSLYITEDGFRSEIRLDRKPNLLQAAYLLASVSGNLPSGYVQQPTVMTDADGKEYVYDTALKFRNWLEAAKYPVIIDPDFTGTTANGVVYGQNADYTTCRSTSSAEFTDFNTSPVGQKWTGAVYNCWRLYFPFDTSSIGAGSTVTQANLKFTRLSDNSATDFDIQIVKWSGGATREARYDNALSDALDDSIWAASNGVSNNTPYTSGNLSTAWVNKTGTTNYALRSSRDSAGNEPTGEERIDLYGAKYTTAAYRPVLTVLYSAGGIAIPVAQYYYDRLRKR